MNRMTFHANKIKRRLMHARGFQKGNYIDAEKRANLRTQLFLYRWKTTLAQKIRILLAR